MKTKIERAEPIGTACRHCGGLIVFVGDEWQHVSTENLHLGMPPESSRGAPPQTAAEFWPGWADRNPIENWDEEVSESSVAIEFAEDYAAEKLKSGHVVLLEAFRRAHLYFLQSNDLTAEDWEVLDEMRAAIQQAERT